MKKVYNIGAAKADDLDFSDISDRCFEMGRASHAEKGGARMVHPKKYIVLIAVLFCLIVDFSAHGAPPGVRSGTKATKAVAKPGPAQAIVGAGQTQAAGTASGNPLDNWVWRNPLPQGNPLRGVAYGNNTFVAVGYVSTFPKGTIVTSPDGTTWTAPASSTVPLLNAVAFGNGTFVAVGYDYSSGNGAIVTSPDGTTWTPRAAGAISHLNAVTFSNATFMAVGDNGAILTSPDGTTWTPNTSGTTSRLTGITFGNNLFVATGYSSGAGCQDMILTSPDGITWTEKSLGTGTCLNAVAFGNGQFVVQGSGGIFTSPDGATWTKRTIVTNAYLYGITFGNNQFVAVGWNYQAPGSGIILTSPDGVTWTKMMPGTKLVFIDSVGFGNGQFVALGYGGSILTSSDGTTWTERISGTTAALSGITLAANTFVAVGATGTIVTSLDGTTWTERISGTTAALANITYAANTFVAVGKGGTILTSLDGTTWTERDSGTAADLSSITFASNTFVAVGASGTILTSPDGTTWAPAVSGTTDDLRSITFGNGTFVAVGTSTSTIRGTILTSPDGTTWTARGMSGSTFYGVAFARGTFVAVGAYQVMRGPKPIYWVYVPIVFASPDGTVWTPSTPAYLKDDTFLYGVAFADDTFVAVGSYGIVLNSPDGTTWTPRTSGTANDLKAVTARDQTFVAVGSYGTILQSGPITSLVVTKSGAGSGLVTSSPWGIECGTACAAPFSQGQEVTLTATADYGSNFTGWTGGGCSGTGACQVTITSDITVSAGFALKSYTLTATTTGPGSGTLSAPGLACTGATCTGTYIYKTPVTITAKPAASFICVWTGCGSASGNTCTVNMTSNKSVTARFVSSTYTLTATRKGSGTGTLSAPSLVCTGATCSATYPYNTIVTVTANPATGSTFTGWTGCDSTRQNTCILTMSSNKNVTATFTINTYTLTATRTGSGTGTFSGSGLKCTGTTCTGTYPYNTVVNVRAVPAAGSVFAGWTGCDSASGDSCTVTMAGSRTISGAFIAMPTTLSVIKSGSGTVVSSPAGIDCGSACSAPFASGTPVSLSAIPDTGYAFAYWSGVCGGAASTCTVTMGSGANVAGAAFVPASTRQYRLTAAKKKANAGDGTVTSADGTINCGATCTRLYYPMATITLTAKPAAGSTFTGWTGACSGKGACAVTMSNARAVGATFAGPVKVTVGKQHITKGDGTITSTPSGIDCGNTCIASYAPGTSIVLTAKPVPGSTFTGWKPASPLCSTGTCTLTLNAPKAVSAVFVGPQQLTLVKRKPGGGDGTVTSSPAGINCGTTCTAPFTYRQTVTLTAVPASGSTFAGWAPQSLCRGTGTCTITMNTAKSVTAYFRKKGAAHAGDAREGEE